MCTPAVDLLRSSTSITVQNLIGTINQRAGTADQWSEISRVIRELIEFLPPHFPHLSYAVRRLPSDKWRAFLAGFISISAA